MTEYVEIRRIGEALNYLHAFALTFAIDGYIDEAVLAIAKAAPKL